MLTRKNWKNIPEPYFNVLDIGSSKISLISAGINDKGQIQIYGAATEASRGIRGGSIIDLNSVMESIGRAVDRLSHPNRLMTRDVFISLSGNHVQSMNSTGMITVRDGEVSLQDVEKVLKTATAGCHLNDQQIIHVLPQEYSVDKQSGIKMPVGMAGSRLDVKAHVIYVAVSAAQNIVKCVRRCGLNPVDLVMEPLASARSVLNMDDRDMGSCVIDIGGGTTGVAVCLDNTILYTNSIPLGGWNITSDISRALAIPKLMAEEVKIQYGNACPWMVDPAWSVHVDSAENRVERSISAQSLANVISPRVQEIFAHVKDSLESSGIGKELTPEFVLTGGSSLMPGMQELAEEIFQGPVRVASPVRIDGLPSNLQSPMGATAVGLLLYAREQYQHEVVICSDRPKWVRVFERTTSWASSNF